MTKPDKAGCYWGRWHTVRPGTTDEHELREIIGEKWEVHTVTENTLDPDDPEHLMVEVPGVERWQSLDSFEWGERVERAVLTRHDVCSKWHEFVKVYKLKPGSQVEHCIGELINLIDARRAAHGD